MTTDTLTHLHTRSCLTCIRLSHILKVEEMSYLDPGPPREEGDRYLFSFNNGQQVMFRTQLLPDRYSTEPVGAGSWV